MKKGVEVEAGESRGRWKTSEVKDEEEKKKEGRWRWKRKSSKAEVKEENEGRRWSGKDGEGREEGRRTVEQIEQMSSE